MSNDQSFGTVLSLLVGGAAGYAAGRWIVEPWLATRATAKPVARRSGVPIDPYAGPSGSMQPIDPYSDAPSIATAPVVAPAPVVTAPNDPPTVGPITSPSQVEVVPTDAGPITSPSQVAPTGPITSPQVVGTSTPPPPTPNPGVTVGGGKSATSSRVRRFDAVFERYRGSIPLAYLRALVDRESNGRPDVRTGSAVGLMQIVPVVLADYNKRHGTAVQSAQLVDPATNVAIGCELLHLIANSYRKNHPHVPNLQTDWDNPRFVELLTFGWNAGFSEAGGVGRVARYLEKLGAIDITLDQITAHARVAGASKHLSNQAKVAWCKSVVALYLRERTLADAPMILVA
ncbi:MAG: transglycosylase SLT domain-containing protein [Kofleriaceae bacterium]